MSRFWMSCKTGVFFFGFARQGIGNGQHMCECRPAGWYHQPQCIAALRQATTRRHAPNRNRSVGICAAVGVKQTEAEAFCGGAASWAAAVAAAGGRTQPRNTCRLAVPPLPRRWSPTRSHSKAVRAKSMPFRISQCCDHSTKAVLGAFGRGLRWPPTLRKPPPHLKSCPA